jgi:hypothetical protein
MPQVQFNPAHKQVIDSMLLPNPLVRPGKMFGYPAYYVGKKLFACLYEDGVGLKLPGEMVQALLDESTFIHFQPMGRRIMREWVQICRSDSTAYTADEALFTASIEFVAKSQ